MVEKYDALDSALSTAFDTIVEIRRIAPVEKGANRATHWVATTAAGSRYGLKVAARVNLGTERELVAANMAEEAGIPHACRARRIDADARFPGPFAAHPFVAVVWMNGDIGDLDTARDSIRAHQVEFLRLYGIWSVFTALIGTTDRNQGNHLWNRQTLSFCHIDLEDSFGRSAGVREGTFLGFKEQLIYARSHGGLEGDRWRQHADDMAGNSLAAGIRVGHDLVTRAWPRLVPMFDAAKAPPSSVEDAGMWASLSTEEKIAAAKRLV